MIATRAESRRQSERIIVAESYLTPREYQVVALYIDGLRNAEICATLRMAPQTVGNHILRASERIGANTIYQLIAMVAASDALRGRGRTSNRDTKSVVGPHDGASADLRRCPLTQTSASELPRKPRPLIL